MIILFAVSALTGLAMVAKSLITGTFVPVIFDICKPLTIYFQQFMSFRYNFLKNSERKAIAKYGAPEIINSDQGHQFMCLEWEETCAEHLEMRISMDGRGRAKDNIWIERFWRTIKYDYIYIQPEENGAALYQGILRFIDDYNYHRHHQGIDRQIPSKLYLRSAA